ncbi:hypothetical protein Trichorick_01417 (plasmid) [Candidatus Trichorickettsia mobilis]|uniref:Single-stranded DNA-binding protein n=1 Tax=Candidatus Trichorickettsia mobilis TaxID=1346319 RepID=A0ABZ0UTZ3_9RICK|nr:hypothetical protein [Candidatus Trichorickettsia mobilis]WPY01504.1 hypothetical protein Trichorick_01417 [Candidatus Trichorickettsia mobilis]
MHEYMNFNNAEPQVSLIPKGTIAKAAVTLRGGNHGDEALLSKSEKTGSIGLNVEFTITEGEYKNRKIFQLLGIQGNKKDDSGNDIWGSMGRSLIRGILESAHNISHEDESPKAQAIRDLDKFSKLNNLQCLVKIGVEVDKTGQYDDKNKVIKIITLGTKEYNEYYNTNPIASNQVSNGKYVSPAASSKSVGHSDLDDELPF